jgi:hypothetical protein
MTPLPAATDILRRVCERHSLSATEVLESSAPLALEARYEYVRRLVSEYPHVPLTQIATRTGLSYSSVHRFAELARRKGHRCRVCSGPIGELRARHGRTLCSARCEERGRS